MFEYKGTVIAQLWPRKDFFSFSAFEYNKEGLRDSECLRIENPNKSREKLFEKIRRYITYLN